MLHNNTIVIYFLLTINDQFFFNASFLMIVNYCESSTYSSVSFVSYSFCNNNFYEDITKCHDIRTFRRVTVTQFILCKVGFHNQICLELELPKNGKLGLMAQLSEPSQQAIVFL